MRNPITALLLCLAAAVSTQAQLVPEGAVPQKIADGYQFTEGPALGPDGCIYFTDIPAELILKFDPESGETTTYLKNTGRANGLMFFRGVLHACEHGNRRVSSGVVDKEFIDRTEAYQYEGKKLNSPNDLTIDKNWNIYFTDPRYGNRDNMEMEIEGVYFIGPALNDAGERPDPVRIDADLVRPNGIVLSPDETILYVADNGANYIYAYDIESPGKVQNKRIFGRINDGKGGGSDGMTVDKQGRLYATGHSKVWVFEPTGQLVATIAVGKQTTNVTFGADGKTLYITANKGLYRITLNTDAPLEHAEKA